MLNQNAPKTDAKYAALPMVAVSREVNDTVTMSRGEFESLMRAFADATHALRLSEQKPAFYTAFDKPDGKPAVALWQYAGPSEHSVIKAVLSVARGQGFKGTGVQLMQELGWWVGPVFAAPGGKAY